MTTFRKFQQNKLWRDKAPELMNAMGSIVHWQRLDDTAFINELRIKFLEETTEVMQAQSTDELIEELADVLEVIKAFCTFYQIDFNVIVEKQQQKKDARGGFEERKFVTIAEHPTGSFGEEYCLKQPEKYPEIF